MSIAALVQEMVDAGATPQLIAIAVKAVEAAGANDEARKAKDRERKRLSKEFPRKIQGTSEEIPGTVSQVSPPIDNITLTPPSSPSISPITRARRVASRLSIDFQLTEAMRAYGREHGLSKSQIDAEGKAMRDWSLSSPNGSKIDWEATWRTWIRRVIAEPRAGPNGSNSKSQRVESFLRLLRPEDEPSGCDSEENGRTIDLSAEEFSRSDGGVPQRG